MKCLVWIFSRLLYILILLVLGGFAGMWWFAWHESDPILNPVSPESSTLTEKPSSAPGLSLDYFEFKGADGKSYQACIARRDEAGTATPAQLKIIDNIKQAQLSATPKGYLLIATEWTKGISSSLAQAELFTAAGFTCILWDSIPTDDEQPFCSHGFFEHKNVPFLIDTCIAKEGAIHPIMALGYGYGASLLLQAAAVDPRIRNIVAIDAYTTLKEIIQHRELATRGKLLSYFTFFLIDAGLSLRGDYRSFQVAPVAATSKLNIPVMVACTEEYVNSTQKDAALIYGSVKSNERAVYNLRGNAPISQKTRPYIPMVKGINERKAQAAIDLTLYQDEDELNKLIISWLNQHTSNPLPQVIIGEEFLNNQPSTPNN